MGFCKARTVQGEQITAAAGKLWATTKVSRNSSSSNIVFIAFLLLFCFWPSSCIRAAGETHLISQQIRGRPPKRLDAEDAEERRKGRHGTLSGLCETSAPSALKAFAVACSSFVLLKFRDLP
jgi:hypothetical protein